MNHLDMKELLTLARRGAQSEHLESCSFCSEQYQLAVEYLQFTPDMVHKEDSPGGEPDIQEYGRSTYRLAAQSAPNASPVFRLRRTWYFENNSTILRVIEDVQRSLLTGFYISEREGKDAPRIRFDGIEKEFTPDINGVFDIGDAAINIEPMTVTLVRS
ncbi:MAG: hypothetical protein C0600_04025 [Ignavibacteria bacterium]|nr:MAG: hypothetical protein C0600_04025 [Ignavibacteria bacterium]